MTDDEIRTVCFKQSQRVQDLKISQKQVRILHFLSDFINATTEDVSENIGGSLQSVGASLHVLYHKGYVTRKQVTQVSGGYQYVYNIKGQLI